MATVVYTGPSGIERGLQSLASIGQGMLDQEQYQYQRDTEANRYQDQQQRYVQQRKDSLIDNAMKKISDSLANSPAGSPDRKFTALQLKMQGLIDDNYVNEFVNAAQHIPPEEQARIKYYESMQPRQDEKDYGKFVTASLSQYSAATKKLRPGLISDKGQPYDGMSQVPVGQTVVNTGGKQYLVPSEDLARIQQRESTDSIYRSISPYWLNPATRVNYENDWNAIINSGFSPDDDIPDWEKMSPEKLAKAMDALATQRKDAIDSGTTEEVKRKIPVAIDAIDIGAAFDNSVQSLASDDKEKVPGAWFDKAYGTKAYRKAFDTFYHKLKSDNPDLSVKEAEAYFKSQWSGRVDESRRDSFKSYIDPESYRIPDEGQVGSIDLSGEETTPDEAAFQAWYKNYADQLGLNPNPDDPRHHYDYRAAFRAGAGPDMTTRHWPSQFKLADHPNRFVNGIDTITGNPAPAQAQGQINQMMNQQQQQPMTGQDDLGGLNAELARWFNSPLVSDDDKKILQTLIQRGDKQKLNLAIMRLTQRYGTGR